MAVAGVVFDVNEYSPPRATEIATVMMRYQDKDEDDNDYGIGCRGDDRKGERSATDVAKRGEGGGGL